VKPFPQYVQKIISSIGLVLLVTHIKVFANYLRMVVPLVADSKGAVRDERGWYLNNGKCGWKACWKTTVN
jgi:hypothetical protein